MLLFIIKKNMIIQIIIIVIYVFIIQGNIWRKSVVCRFVNDSVPGLNLQAILAESSEWRPDLGTGAAQSEWSSQRKRSTFPQSNMYTQKHSVLSLCSQRDTHKMNSPTAYQ